MNAIDNKIDFIYKEQILISQVKEYYIETNEDLKAEIYEKIKTLLKELYNII